MPEALSAEVVLGWVSTCGENASLPQPVMPIG